MSWCVSRDPCITASGARSDGVYKVHVRPSSHIGPDSLGGEGVPSWRLRSRTLVSWRVPGSASCASSGSIAHGEESCNSGEHIYSGSPCLTCSWAHPTFLQPVFRCTSRSRRAVAILAQFLCQSRATEIGLSRRFAAAQSSFRFSDESCRFFDTEVGRCRSRPEKLSCLGVCQNQGV